MPLKATPEDLRLWQKICESITPFEGKERLIDHPHIHIQAQPKPIPSLELPPMRLELFDLGQSVKTQGRSTYIPALKASPDSIEPGRRKRLERERDDIEAVLDLHGLTSLQAETIVKSFVIEAHNRGYRAIMIITGKGQGRTGVLKSQTPQWLSEPRHRAIIAGISQAHPRHGGSGALYVALKRKRVNS